MLLLLSFACTRPAPTPDSGQASVGCNGALAYCEMPYDQTTVLGTHNSMSNEQEGWLAPNQLQSVLAQLEMGVRALNFDVYEEGGELLTCHGYCSLGSKPLVQALSELQQWLDDNPNQVLSLTFESYISAAQMQQAFESADLVRLSYERDPVEPWPTLNQLIGADTRLVVWTDSQGGEPAWYGQIDEQVWETDYAYKEVEDFGCVFRRGREDQSYVIMAHFLTAPLASQELARQANTAVAVRAHAQQCSDIGRRPNLILVDFASVGDVSQVVEELGTLWSGEQR